MINNESKIISFLKIFKFFDLIWFNRSFTWLPISWTNFSVLVCVFKSVDKSDCLVNWPTHSIVVDLDASYLAFAIDDKQST
jgi:hypothetical protein